MRASRPVVLAAVLGLVAAACGAPAAGGAGGDAADVTIDRPPDPVAAAEVATAVNALGFDLLRGLDEGGNTIVSPLSVSALVAMILAGAGGETREAIAATLHLDPDDPQVERYADLLLLLAEADDVLLAIANSLWAAAGVGLEEAYLDLVRPTFGATVEEVDLGAQETADRIDAWVVERTEGLIDGIAEALGLPNQQAVLVLLNAVYFKGTWTDPFESSQTREQPFTRRDGTQAEAPLMSRDGLYAMGRGDGFTLARLPYADGRFGMEVLLPDGDVEALLDSLDAETWGRAVDSAEEGRAYLSLPRFDLAYDAVLNDVLTDLGMGVAFGGGADFRPMSPSAPWVDVIAHKSRIIVDEEGTEAAAVTGGTMVTSMPPEFRVDRPFVFTISDRETGAILFLGVVGDPTG